MVTALNDHRESRLTGSLSLSQKSLAGDVMLSLSLSGLVSVPASRRKIISCRRAVDAGGPTGGGNGLRTPIRVAAGRHA